MWTSCVKTTHIHYLGTSYLQPYCMYDYMEHKTPYDPYNTCTYHVHSQTPCHRLITLELHASGVDLGAADSSLRFDAETPRLKVLPWPRSARGAQSKSLCHAALDKQAARGRLTADNSHFEAHNDEGFPAAKVA